MRKKLVLGVVCTIVSVFLSGCAVVTNVRRQEGRSEQHIVSILGIPLWMSETPIDKSAERR